MVVEVLVAQGDGGDPLGEQGALVVDDEDRMAGVGDRRVEGVAEADPVGHLGEEQGAAVGGEPSALEVGDDGLGPTSGKVEGIAVTVCPGDGLACGRIWASLLRVRKVMHAEVGGPSYGTSSEGILDPHGPSPVRRSPARPIPRRLSARGCSTAPTSTNSTATRPG